MSINLSLVEQARQSIAEKLRPLLDKPNGVIYERHHQKHRLIIKKRNTEIALFFAHAKTGELSGIMSEMDLIDPLKLIFGYTRAFMLSLLWKDNPQKVYMLGFAGGRVPMVMYHYYPEVVIESTELDPHVLEIAQSYFAIQLDERQKVTLEDGRLYLEKRPESMYDIILVDAFIGTGFVPHDLTTVEFYDLLKAHLNDDGVVAVNVGIEDPLYRERINTFRGAFKYTYLLDYDTAKVVFGSNVAELTKADIFQRSEALIERHQFSFPLLNYAQRILSPNQLDQYLISFGRGQTLLHDGVLPDMITNMSRTDAIFHHAGRNEPCPCGSGKKFKHCHGSK
jgi:spermidine synthase